MNSVHEVALMQEHAFAEVWFDAPRTVSYRQVAKRSVPKGHLRLAHLVSSVSAGTEMLAYRGQLPTDIALDASIEGFEQPATYPLRYGYAFVGKVIELGEGVDASWLGRSVFAFAPHGSYADVDVHSVIPVPDDISAENASFLANMETAVNLLHDAKPLLGEKIVVLGQGIVGLLVTALLSQFPLSSLRAIDRYPLRLEWARQLGADAYSPDDKVMPSAVDADVVIELTGVPQALDDAIRYAGFSSRIVIGSWYGAKSAPVYLGGAAHRNRLSIITSQVSTLAPELTGRWTKERRFDATWDMIRRVQPARFITHRAPLHQAASLYQQVDQAPDQVIQAVFAS